jgi:DNA-binding MarR family transcriptional regulator
MAPARRIVRTPPSDYVSRLLAAWQVERPDLEVAPVAIVYRLIRLAGRLGPEVEKAFAGSGISNADFSVLAILRRRPAPYRVSQKFLQEALGITSGTISVRIDRLVDLGLVARQSDHDDARSVQVALTPKGEHVFDGLATKHLDNEARLVSALGGSEQAELSRLLQMLLSEFEPLADPPGRHLGISVLSSHVSHERRQAVGLDEVPGLLVDEVTADSPADRAGLRKGDLIVRSGTMQVRSLTCLQGAIDLGRRQVPLTVQRGDETLTLSVDS